MTRKHLDIGSDNPRMQCEMCGKWRRLITKNEQIMFPYYVKFDGQLYEVYDCLCLPCHGILEPVVPALRRAFEAGLETITPTQGDRKRNE